MASEVHEPLFTLVVNVRGCRSRCPSLRSRHHGLRITTACTDSQRVHQASRCKKWHPKCMSHYLFLIFLLFLEIMVSLDLALLRLT